MDLTSDNIINNLKNIDILNQNNLNNPKNIIENSTREIYINSELNNIVNYDEYLEIISSLDFNIDTNVEKLRTVALMYGELNNISTLVKYVNRLLTYSIISLEKNGLGQNCYTLIVSYEEKLKNKKISNIKDIIENFEHMFIIPIAIKQDLLFFINTLELYYALGLTFQTLKNLKK